MANIEATVTETQLIQAVSQLSPSRLERFIEKVLQLRKQHEDKASESELLHKINSTTLPTDKRTLLFALQEKRKAHTLFEREHTELCQLSEQWEELHAQRLTYAGELAQLQSKPIEQVLHELNLVPTAET